MPKKTKKQLMTCLTPIIIIGVFFWHLTLEKSLKALLTKQDKEIPFTHNLLNLVSTAKIILTDVQEKELREINTFNLEARYDDYKLSFYKKATKEYAIRWITICTKWLQKIKALYE